MQIEAHASAQARASAAAEERAANEARLCAAEQMRIQNEEQAALAARERAASEDRLAVAAHERRLAEAQTLQEIEARIEAEQARLQAAQAKARAESAAALQARKSADILVHLAQAVTRRTRRSLWLKRVALAGAALTAITWAGASWYFDDAAVSAARPALNPALSLAPLGLEAEMEPAAHTGFALNLKTASALQNAPADR